MLMNAMKHIKKILIHKWYVFNYCKKSGITWRGIKHDMSKFSPTEFFESVKYYQGTSSPIDECKKQNGYSKAWQHHKGRNTHHYEHWTDNYDSGTTTIRMPYKDAVEMFCDYISAGRAYMGEGFDWEKELDWWKAKRKQAKMHPSTKRFIDTCFVYSATLKKFPSRDMLDYYYQSSLAHYEDKNEYDFEEFIEYFRSMLIKDIASLQK